MAAIKGTKGNDTLVGTAGDDTITPLLGIDSVDGGAGYDVLTINYGGVAASVFPGSMALGADGSWSGGVSSGVAGGAANAVGFERIERVVFTASQGVDYLFVDLGTLALDPTRLRLNGAGGDDILAIDAAAVDTATALTLSVASDGKIKSNAGLLAGWEAFDISLGKAIGNKLTLGAGDDAVRSTGGRDVIALGAGDDSWTGSYADRTDSLALSFSYQLGLKVTSGNTLLATVTGAETINAALGTGGDVVGIYEGAGHIDGGTGGGGDSLFVKYGGDTARTITMTALADGSLSTAFDETSDSHPMTLTAFEYLNLLGSSADDALTLDDSKSALADTGTDGDYLVILDGEQGTDSVLLDLRADGAAEVGTSFEGLGFGYLTWEDTTNVVNLRNIEALTVRFGVGDDRFEAGIAQTNVVDGGLGADTIDFGASTTGVSFQLGNQAAQSVGGASYTVKNVENLSATGLGDTITDNAAGNVIQLLAGDDRLLVNGLLPNGADVFDGGDGIDTIDFQLTSGGATVDLSTTAAQDTGISGTLSLSGFENVIGSTRGDVLTGSDGDNYVFGGYGDDVLQGLGGNDLLYGFNGIDTASYSRATAAVTVSLDNLLAQNTGGAGTDTLNGIENLTGSAYADTLTGDAGANRLTGGRGADTLNGRGGADVFVYGSTLDSNASGYDRINDFSHAAGDKVDLSAIDAISNNFVRNDSFTWIGDAAFRGVAGELREVAVRGGGWLLLGDTNGDKVADLTIFVTSSTPLLPNGDIVL